MSKFQNILYIIGLISITIILGYIGFFIAIIAVVAFIVSIFMLKSKIKDEINKPY